MGISSAAEAKLEARIRPEVTVMRARTSYPRRHRPALSALPGGQAEAEARALPPGDSAGGALHAVRAVPWPGGESGAGGARGARAMAGAAEPRPADARMFRSSASFSSARTIRTATSVASARSVSSARAARAVSAARSVRAGRLVASDRGARDRPVRGTAPIRLTRRGRFVAGVLAGVAIAAGAMVIWLAVSGQAQAASKAAPVPAAGHRMLRVVVRPGQTLWSIATKADPSADPRIVIQQIIDDNALSGTTVTAGQVLWVPRS